MTTRSWVSLVITLVLIEDRAKKTKPSACCCGQAQSACFGVLRTGLICLLWVGPVCILWTGPVCLLWTRKVCLLWAGTVFMLWTGAVCLLLSDTKKNVMILYLNTAQHRHVPTHGAAPSSTNCERFSIPPGRESVLRVCACTEPAGTAFGGACVERGGERWIKKMLNHRH